MPSCGNSTPSGPDNHPRCSAEANATHPLPRPAREAHPFQDEEFLAISCGPICMHRKKACVSTLMSGRRLGLKEGDDAIWLVSFMHYELGSIGSVQRGCLSSI